MSRHLKDYSNINIFSDEDTELVPLRNTSHPQDSANGESSEDDGLPTDGGESNPWMMASAPYQNINCDKNIALYNAASTGNDKEVCKLLNEDVDANYQDKEGRTPLLVAICNKELSCINILINKSDISLEDKSGRGVLHYAVQTRSPGLLKDLLGFPGIKERINYENLKIGTPLLYAIHCFSFECVEVLLDEGASVTLACEVGGNLQFPLHEAAKSGMCGICQRIVNIDVNTLKLENGKGETPLHMAVHGKRKKGKYVVQLLSSLCIKYNYELSQVNADGETPMHIAAKNGKEMFVKELLHGSVTKSDKQKNVPLHNAAGSGSLASCQLLVRKAKSMLYHFNADNYLPLDMPFEKDKKKDREEKKEDHVKAFLVKNTSLSVIEKKAKKPEKKRLLSSLKQRMKTYFDDALKKKKKIVVEAIISSDWWATAMSPRGDATPSGLR
ncbi:serine/threonine-protein phosphatase 6 regulatory ankyrin repeat subunit A-like isoform X2 [Homarus americanus]|uniref:serine/threonine-protein phosphatase 6 regulatory ankyrin repeat subunit A-like isoform X2 n=1 Tax=Homarus americanus TaxID=6706 RepID=UPI001C441940|nr:serine/threonine-protein phosphatase 6 regulatory ankyrin repeat subunit A-like isoform X2 [Homarus americanus]XP_042242828.1 serine/threonine-protein phosphatase 6 regulatory ankyrin repeat subunit A-like isoform X2 [Homarus americanus]